MATTPTAAVVVAAALVAAAVAMAEEGKSTSEQPEARSVERTCVLHLDVSMNCVSRRLFCLLDFGFGRDS